MSIARLMFWRASSSNGIHMWLWPPAFLKHGLAASTLCATRGPMGRQLMDRLDLCATMLFDVELQKVTEIVNTVSLRGAKPRLANH